MQLKRTIRLLQYRIGRSRSQYTLYASVLFSLALLLFRIIHSGSYLRASLVWNLFLAYVPFAVTRWMEKHPEQIQNRYNWYGCFIV